MVLRGGYAGGDMGECSKAYVLTGLLGARTTVHIGREQKVIPGAVLVKRRLCPNTGLHVQPCRTSPNRASANRASAGIDQKAEYMYLGHFELRGFQK